jgi:hypothetical protein
MLGGVHPLTKKTHNSKYIALDTRGDALQVWDVYNNISRRILMHLGTERAFTWLADGRLALIDTTKTTQFIDIGSL